MNLLHRDGSAFFRLVSEHDCEDLVELVFAFAVAALIFSSCSNSLLVLLPMLPAVELLQFLDMLSPGLLRALVFRF